MSASLSISSAGFDKMLRDLQQMAGSRGMEAFAPAIKGQVGKVLETAVRYTPVATAAKAAERAGRKVESRHNTFGSGVAGAPRGGERPLPYVSVTKNGKWWVDANKDGKRTFYKMDGARRWGEQRWQAYQQQERLREQSLTKERTQAVRKAKAARGLSKKAWVKLADALGVPIKVAGFIRKAVPTTGITYSDSRTRTVSRGSQYYVEVETSMPVLVHGLGGRKILERSIATRVKAFEGDMRRAVFDDLKVRAQRWPGVFVSP